MTKSVRIGSSLCTAIRGQEKFLTVEMSGGDIVLLNKSTKIATRQLKDDDTFKFNNTVFQIKR